VLLTKGKRRTRFGAVGGKIWGAKGEKKRFTLIGVLLFGWGKRASISALKNSHDPFWPVDGIARVTAKKGRLQGEDVDHFPGPKGCYLHLLRPGKERGMRTLKHEFWGDARENFTLAGNQKWTKKLSQNRGGEGRWLGVPGFAEKVQKNLNCISNRGVSRGGYMRLGWKVRSAWQEREEGARKN